MGDSRKSVKDTLKRLGSKFNKKGSDPVIVSPKDGGFTSNIPYGVSTQSLMLDLAIGRPGIPGGRLTEVCGLESTSKSTLILHLLSEVQSMGGIGVLVETEQCFDSSRSEVIGVNLDKLIVSQPDTMEVVFETIEAVIKDIRNESKFKGPVLIAWDSVASTSINAELEGEYGDALMGAHARTISKAMRKIVPIMSRNDVTLVFVNQLKTDLKQTFSRVEKHQTFGGKAIRFASSLRFEVKRRNFVPSKKRKDKVIGVEVAVTAIKNKVAPPMGKADITISFERGLNKLLDLLDAGIYMGLIEQRGSWYIYKDKKFQRSGWKQIVLDLGGWEKVKAEFVDYAIKEKWLVPYGD